jgi:subtilisin family serine protease
MRKTTIALASKASISLAPVLAETSAAVASLHAPRVMGLRAPALGAPITESSTLTSVLIRTTQQAALERELQSLTAVERVLPLRGGYLSAHLEPETLRKLVDLPGIARIQTKKQSAPHLTAVFPEIGLLTQSTGLRAVPEDGSGVLIGVVDSGFDLSHPAFHDESGNLRVEALLDQVDGSRELNAAQLSAAIAAGNQIGRDSNGHGTHVAGIAGGSLIGSFAGVATGARFLLVKTDFRNTDEAVTWIFEKAAGRPCVVNMSLGHHLGAHDGTDSEERLHRTLTGPGKLLVVSAGNEQNDNLHLGGRFSVGQVQEVTFNLLRPRQGRPTVILTLWHDPRDRFDISLVTPSGQLIPPPAMGTTDRYNSPPLSIDFSRRRNRENQALQVQISIEFASPLVTDRDLQGWGLRINCRRSVLGRIDGWFHNSGFAAFANHPLVEASRTIGLPATGEGCIAVASHVAKVTWDTDLGLQRDVRAVVGRTSPFSSLGPTRDGRSKPEVSAPGQYVTAALASGSELAEVSERVFNARRLLTIEGTSMAAPVVTGILALMLQRKPTLSVAEARQILTETARHDAHTGLTTWNPAYGHGKVDVAAALSRL